MSRPSSAQIFRGFIAVDIEPTDQLRLFSENLRGAKAAMKLVELKNFHLTLKFLGNTRAEILPEIVSVMKGSVEGIEPFTMTLRGVGVFPSIQHIKVIWVGIHGGERLSQIAGFLDEELKQLGFKREKREFRPHATIARMKGKRGKERIQEIIKANRETLFGQQLVDGIRLKKSVLTPEGPIYSVLEEVKFG